MAIYPRILSTYPRVRARKKPIGKVVLGGGILFCLLMSARPARAQLASCELHRTDLAQLCAALRPTRWNFSPKDLQQSIDIVAGAITQAPRTADPVQILAQSIDPMIRHSFVGKAANYCDALDNLANGRFKDQVATACLRPTCLLQVPEEIAASPPECDAITAPARETLRGAAVLAGAQVLTTVPCVQGQPSCLRVDSEAVATVALVDQLRPLIRTFLKDARPELPDCSGGRPPAGCAANIGAFLNRALTTWAKGSAIKQFLADYPELAKKLDPDKSFIHAWANIESEVDDFKKPGSGRVFPWDSKLFFSLRTVEEAISKITDRATAVIEAANAADVLALWQRGQGLLVVLKQNPTVLSDATLKAFYDAWSNGVQATLGDSPDSKALGAAETRIRSQQQLLTQAEKVIPNIMANLVFGDSATSAEPCSAGKHTIDWIHGTLDICFPDKFRESWLPGLRFAFAPCKPGERECNTIGDIRVLIPATIKGDGTNWIALPTGISAIKARVSSNGVALSGLPPERTYLGPKPTVVAALQRIIPPPLHVVDYERMEVLDGPTVEFKNLKLALTSIGVSDITLPDVSLSGRGLVVTGTWYAGDSDFETAIINSLSAALKKQTTLAGVNVTNAHLLKNSDQCGTITYVGGDSQYGICADLPMALLSQSVALRVVVTVDSAGQLSIRPAFDPAPVIEKLNGALGTALSRVIPQAVTPTIESLTFRNVELQLSLQGGGSPPCMVIVSESLTNPSLDVNKVVNDNLQCFARSAVSVLSNALHGFSLLGFDFSTIQNNKVCLSTDARICIIGPVVSADGQHVDFSHARLDDGGRLSALLATKLTSFLPGALVSVSSVAISNGQLALGTEWQIPGLAAPLAVPVLIGGDMNLSADPTLAAYAAVGKALEGVSARWGSLETKILTADVSSNSLVVHGTVTFNPVNPVSVGITVQILPFLKVNPPSVDEVAAQIFNIISALGRRGPSSPQLSMGRNYQLILRVPIIVTVPIGGFSGLSVGAVVEATPTSSFHFAGPVLVSVPIWIPTGFELDIGNLQAMVDLNALDNFSLGASVALTPGEELYDVFSFDGNLAVNMRESTVSLGGQLSVLRVPVSSVTGKWQIQEGVLRVDTTSIVGNLLPIPQTHVIVDGPGCAIVGTANAKLVGIELLQGSAVVLFPCTGNHTPIPDTAKLVLSCGSAGNLGRVCVTGQASLGNIAQAMTSFDSSLLTPSPHMRARINVLDISDVSVEASSAMVKLEARLLMIDLSVFLPSLENVNADDVRKLFENMLRPSINLQALLSGKIVISPTSGSGNGEGMSDGDGNGGGPSNGGGNGVNPPSSGANGSAPAGTASPVITSAPGSGTLDIEPVKGWSGAVQLVYKSGSFTGPYYWDGSVILRASDEGQKFKNHLLFPIPNSAKGVLSNGRPYILACDSNPCNDVTISLVPLLKPPDETGFNEQTRHLGNLTGGASVALISKGFLVAPQLANYLAERVYEGKNIPAMQCLPEQSAGCNSVLLRDSTAARPWAIYFYGRVQPIEDASFIDLLTHRCDAGAGTCPPPVLKAISDSRTGVFGWHEQPDNSISLLMAHYEWPEMWIIHRRYDKDLTVISENKISIVRNEWVWPTPSVSSSPRTLGWSDLAAKLQSLQDQTWQLRRAKHGSAEFYALIGTNPNNAERPVISALGKTGGHLCVRMKTYSTLMSDLRVGWVDCKDDQHKDGPHCGGIHPDAFKDLDASIDGSRLLSALSNPHESDGEYRISPILWMGNPGNPTECQ